MNKFQKAGLAVVAASGIVFAGNLWGPNPLDFPSLQVKVPQALDCWAADPDPATSACYDATAGWWYGYDYEGGSVDVKKQGTFIYFGEGVGLSDEADGSSLIDSDALYVRLTAKSTSGGEVYGGAGIGFDFRKSGSENINAKGGYCLTYESDGDMLLKLGHNEKTYSDACTREIELPTKKTPGMVEKAWAAFEFPGWCLLATAPTNKVPDAVPLSEAVSVKIATYASNKTTPTVVNFRLCEFGWQGSCTGTCAAGDGLPIIGGKPTQSGVSFAMEGRMLSVSVTKATAVQVYNMQGAVVKTQTLTPEIKTINLSNMPAGIYMVSAPSLGYTGKIMLK
jgi:hypothetical protein